MPSASCGADLAQRHRRLPIRASSTVFLLAAFLVSACGGRTVVVSPREPVSASQLEELRVDPGPAPRDLFWGVGGKRYAPPADAIYRLLAKDETGFSVSFDVTSPDGTEWSAKIGAEAQTEVVVSRILWGLGYHQPPVYYLPSWNVGTGAEARPSAVAQGVPSNVEGRKESEARFRPKLAELERLPDVWNWADNPFSGTRELKGLLVILLMLNSTDLKDSNNSIYAIATPPAGAPAITAGRWFLVRDLGAALGETGKLYPRRNWLEGFEAQAFITSISESAVEFDYKGRHQELLTMIGPGDVQWAAREMARLTDAQWRDAFRAGNYAGPQSDRYITRIKEKIADGLALRVDRRAVADDERR
jgi:hypothetical protein